MTNRPISVPSSDGYVVCVTVSGGSTDASSCADHRSAPSDVTRYRVGGASNEATATNATSPSVSTDCTLINPSSSIESMTGVPSVSHTSTVSTAAELDTTSSRSPRLAALVMHDIALGHDGPPLARDCRAARR